MPLFDTVGQAVFIFLFSLFPVIRRGRLKKKQKKTLPKSSGQADKKWQPFCRLVPWLSFGTTPAISGTGVVNNIGSLMLSWVGWLNTFDSPRFYLSAGRFCFFSSRKRKRKKIEGKNPPTYFLLAVKMYEPLMLISLRFQGTGLRKKCVKKIWGGM